MFDDGSRIILDIAHNSVSEEAAASIREHVAIKAYYEVTRTAKDAVGKLDWSNSYRGKLLLSNEVSRSDDDGFLCRVALQFPDELLSDASEVTWLMEEAVTSAYRTHFLQTLEEQKRDPTPEIQQHLDSPPLIFVLGDSTYGSCCPDEVAAQHLNADVLIHYGYACLSSTSERIPVVYAFGIASVEMSNDKGSFWKDCVDLVSAQVAKSVANATKDISSESNPDEKHNYNLLVLFDLKYHHAINGLQEQIESIDGISSVVMGTIPEQQLRAADSRQTSKNVCCSNMTECDSGVSCGDEMDTQASVACPVQSCCQSNAGAGCYKSEDADHASQKCAASLPPDSTEAFDGDACPLHIRRSIGGLVVPDYLNLSQYTVLYIGDDLNIDASNGSINHNTRLLHILLRCTASDGCQAIWSYSPTQQSLNCNLMESPMPSDSTTFSTFLSRTLRRRYFLIQKAKMATTIGILIGTTVTSVTFRLTLARIRNRIISTGRTAYTFAVGKLATSSSKVSNFAEIDCFVLIACQESIAKFWRMEREDLVVPVITPLELDVALGLRDWDGRYSCDFGDLVRWDKEDGIDNDIEVKHDNVDCDEDQPFFSMISGKYEHSRAPKHNKSNLQQFPGQGQIMEYHSEAAEFFKKREYQGLEANIGETEAKAAVQGQAGIASNYGENM